MHYSHSPPLQYHAGTEYPPFYAQALVDAFDGFQPDFFMGQLIADYGSVTGGFLPAEVPATSISTGPIGNTNMPTTSTSSSNTTSSTSPTTYAIHGQHHEPASSVAFTMVDYGTTATYPPTTTTSATASNTAAQASIQNQGHGLHHNSAHHQHHHQPTTSAPNTTTHQHHPHLNRDNISVLYSHQVQMMPADVFDPQPAYSGALISAPFPAQLEFQQHIAQIHQQSQFAFTANQPLLIGPGPNNNNNNNNLAIATGSLAPYTPPKRALSSSTQAYLSSTHPSPTSTTGYSPIHQHHPLQHGIFERVGSIGCGGVSPKSGLLDCSPGQEGLHSGVTSRSSSIPGSTNSSVKSSGKKKRNLSSASEGNYADEDHYGQHNNRPPKRTRNLGNDRMKAETSQTRLTGACVACQRKKIRCKPSEDKTAACLNCTAVWSRKRQDCTIYQMPCIRAKITATILFRGGPTKEFLWTKRWVSTSFQEIPNWARPSKYTIQITQDRGPPLELIVQEYIPTDGDRQSYHWKREDGSTGTYETGPYAVANIEQTRKTFEQYIDDNLGQYIESCLEGSRPIVVTTFATAMNCIDFPKSQLIKDCLRLFVAGRFIEDSWRLCGKETLGLEPCLERDSPYYDRIPVSPILDFQIDAITINLILKPLKSKILNMLQNKILTTKPDQDWMEIKIATFILLTNIEWTIRHDNEFARRYSLETRFSNQGYIEEAFQSGKNLLWHFRAVAGGGVPFFLDYREGEEKRAREGTGLGDQVAYVKTIKKLADEETARLKALREERRYEAEMYWTSQMFLRDWQPGETPPDGLEMATAPKIEKVSCPPFAMPFPHTTNMSPAVGA